jgi:hypothetical protein
MIEGLMLQTSNIERRGMDGSTWMQAIAASREAMADVVDRMGKGACWKNKLSLTAQTEQKAWPHQANNQRIITFCVQVRGRCTGKKHVMQGSYFCDKTVIGNTHVQVCGTKSENNTGRMVEVIHSPCFGMGHTHSLDFGKKPTRVGWLESSILPNLARRTRILGIVGNVPGVSRADFVALHCARSDSF